MSRSGENGHVVFNAKTGTYSLGERRVIAMRPTDLASLFEMTGLDTDLVVKFAGRNDGTNFHRILKAKAPEADPKDLIEAFVEEMDVGVGKIEFDDEEYEPGKRMVFQVHSGINKTLPKEDQREFFDWYVMGILEGFVRAAFGGNAEAFQIESVRKGGMFDVYEVLFPAGDDLMFGVDRL